VQIACLTWRSLLQAGRVVEETAVSADGLSKEQSLLWHQILHQNGWIAPLWASRRRSKDEGLSQDEIAFYDAFGGVCYLISLNSNP